MIENLIIGGRRSGKTLELIKMSAERNIYIVCADRQRALNIAATARDLGYQIPFPITLMELQIYSRFIQEVFVDDVDVILERIIGRRVSNITLRSNCDGIVVHDLRGTGLRGFDIAPTVEERPKGKWNKFNSYFRKCSLCQKVVGFDYIEQDGEIFNYCPNCGADMRGDL